MSKNNQKSYTPSRRYMTFSDFSDITKKTPEKKLTRPLKKTGGRNNLGRITSRRRGGGHKRRYRIIDFKRDKFDIFTAVEPLSSIWLAPKSNSSTKLLPSPPNP